MRAKSPKTDQPSNQLLFAFTLGNVLRKSTCKRKAYGLRVIDSRPWLKSKTFLVSKPKLFGLTQCNNR